MQPFRDLIKPNKKFYWDGTLESIFLKSKQEIIEKVKDGVKSFELERITCLQTDYCDEGIGYLLLQKYCTCSLEKVKLIYAGSKFTNPAEANY